MVKKKTLVIGGSPNPARYSNIAIKKLLKYGHPVLSLGLRNSQVESVEILTGQPQFTDIDTITLYIGKQNQHQYYNYIIGLNPNRIIFNPGTENSELSKLATDKGIEVVEYCTLIMLGDGLY